MKVIKIHFSHEKYQIKTKKNCETQKYFTV